MGAPPQSSPHDLHGLVDSNLKKSAGLASLIAKATGQPPVESTQPLNPQAVSDQVKAELEASKEETEDAPKEEVKTPPAVREVEPEFGFDAPKEEKDESPEGAKDPEPEGGVLPDAEASENGPENNVAENFKKLRTKLRETFGLIQEKETRISELEKKVKDYETGAVFPEIIQKNENEIQRLSHFEKLHSLKTSREYHETFVKPAEAITTKLREFAADYEVPGHILNQALNLTSNADLNRFLSAHFDGAGALEVKNLVTQLRDIETKRIQAESAPATELARIHAETEQRRITRDAERKSKISSTAKNAWMESGHRIKEEGIMQELILRDNDPVHNEKVALPILTAASKEYGRIVTMLAEAGLEELPGDLAHALAQMTKRAHAASAAAASRDYALKSREELEKTIQNDTRLSRPRVGGGHGISVSANGSGAPKKGQTLEEASRALAHSVLHNSQG